MAYSLPEAAILHNTKTKIYPDGSKKITVCSRAIFKEDGWESQEENASKPKDMSNETRDDSARRAMDAIFDIAMLNKFTHFITWTLDKEKIDRYDVKEISTKLKQFLNNMVRRHGLHYLIVAEFHKDGAIHMHGFIFGDVKLVDSGHKAWDKVDKKWKTVFNMPQWALGYSTAIELTGDRSRVSKYITKYISKDFRKIFGNFYYAGGKTLIRKPPVELTDTDYSKVDSKEYIVPAANLGFKYITEETPKNDIAISDRGIPDRPTDTGEQSQDTKILPMDTEQVLEFYRANRDSFERYNAFIDQTILHSSDNEEYFIDYDTDIHSGFACIPDLVFQ